MLSQERKREYTVATDPPVRVSKWVLVGMRMEIDLGILVHEGDGIEVADFCGRISYKQILKNTSLTMRLEQELVPL